MDYRKFFLALIIGLSVLTSIATAQSQGRAARQTSRAPVSGGPTSRPANSGPATKPGPVGPVAQTVAAAAPPGALALVNGQPITLTDIDIQVREQITKEGDPALQAFFDNPDKEIVAARSRALDARINSLLVDAEAKRRKITADQLLDAEVNSRLPTPTEAEIRQVYDENRQQLGSADLESVRPQIVNYLRGKSAEQLYNALMTRLRMTHTVTKGPDVNSPNLAPGTVLASVGGRNFTAGELDQRMKSYLYNLRFRIYKAEQDVLDQKINDMLLLAEAQRRNVPPETIVQEEITNKIHHPTDAEVAKFYQENKDRINGSLDSLRSQIASYLEDQERERVERAFAERLRTRAQVRVLLAEPEAPVLAVSVDDDPSRGAPNAAVTVVEFTDFQCPACGAMYPVLEDVLKSYGNRVRFVIRDFPLAMHENARKAAEAADAANAQGKYYQYIDKLFRNQTALDVASLKRYASEVGLDRKRFDAELDGGVYAQEVAHDIEDGELYGVNSTPTIFINGVRLNDLTPEGLRAAIERAFAKAGQGK